MKKNILCLLFILFISHFLTADQSILLLPVTFEDMDPESVGFFENELNRQFSTLFDLEIVRESTLDDNTSRYYFESAITIDHENFSFEYKFYDLLVGNIISSGVIVESSLNGVTNSFENDLMGIRSTLRKPPEIVQIKYSQIIIETDIPGSDIFINGESIGVSPVSVSKESGSKIFIEARTVTLKQSLQYRVTEEELKVVSLELEPIVGNFLLKGDILGRTLYINDEQVKLESTSLFRDIPIGLIHLKIEDEWSMWEDSIFVEEDKLLEIDVNFIFIATLYIEIPDGITVDIMDLDGNDIASLTETTTMKIDPGEYIFRSAKDGYITATENLIVDSESITEFLVPELKIDKTEEELARILEVDQINIFNNKINNIQNGTMIGSITSAALLVCGIVGEIVLLDMYNNETVSANAVEYRENGETLRAVNITLLSTGLISFVLNILSNNFIKDAGN